MFNKKVNNDYPTNVDFKTKVTDSKNTKEDKIGNIFDPSSYAINVADKNTAKPKGIDQSIMMQTFLEGGLNLTGTTDMAPQKPKLKDLGTQLSTYPGGGLNLSGTALTQPLVLPSANKQVAFPDDTTVTDEGSKSIKFPSDVELLGTGKEIDFPGNSDLVEEIETGSVLPKTKYIITFPEDVISTVPQNAPNAKVETLVKPQTVSPKISTVAPVQAAPIEKAPVRKLPSTVPAIKVSTAPLKAPIQNIPNASDEIKSFYGKKMSEKNLRLHKMILENEFNPQLKEYLLTCRVDDLVKKVKGMDPQLLAHFSQCCDKYGIKKEEDKLMLLAQMQQESNFNEDAKSRSNALGYMQVIPSTAVAMNKVYYKSSDPLISWDRKMDYTDPKDNIEMGVALMADNLRRYKNSEKPIYTALGAYNAGTQPTDAYLKGATMVTKKGTINAEGETTKYGVPPYDEPQLYYQIISATQDYMLRNPEKIKDVRALLGSNQN